MNLDHNRVEKAAISVFSSCYPEINDVLNFMHMFPELYDTFSLEMYSIKEKMTKAREEMLSVCQKMSMMLQNPKMLDLYKESKIKELKDQVHSLLKDNQMIKAVKLVRDTMGWDLKSSKAFVDEM